MPRLRNLTCQIECSDANIPLEEFQVEYDDNRVETLVPVPETSTPFSVHLTSEGYVAPGLAMFVYINDEYQCNRNRTDLALPIRGARSDDTEIDFCVRQKERPLADGTFESEPWSFKRSGMAGSWSSDGCISNIEEDYGTIEVRVRRCFPSINPPNGKAFRAKRRSAPGTDSSGDTGDGNCDDDKVDRDDDESDNSDEDEDIDSGEAEDEEDDDNVNSSEDEDDKDNNDEAPLISGAFFDGASESRPSRMSRAQKHRPNSTEHHEQKEQFQLTLRGGGPSSTETDTNRPSPELASKSNRTGNRLSQTARKRSPKVNSPGSRKHSAVSYTPDEGIWASTATKPRNTASRPSEQWQGGATWTWDPVNDGDAAVEEPEGDEGKSSIYATASEPAEPTAGSHLNDDTAESESQSSTSGFQLHEPGSHRDRRGTRSPLPPSPEPPETRRAQMPGSWGPPSSSSAESRSGWSNDAESVASAASAASDHETVPGSSPTGSTPDDTASVCRCRPRSDAVRYTHHIRMPRYMDDWDDPYAIFVFHCRDREAIQDTYSTSSSAESASDCDERDRLLQMPKSELVAQLLQTRRAVTSATSLRSRLADRVVDGWDDGNDHLRIEYAPNSGRARQGKGSGRKDWETSSNGQGSWGEAGPGGDRGGEGRGNGAGEEDADDSTGGEGTRMIGWGQGGSDEYVWW